MIPGKSLDLSYKTANGEVINKTVFCPECECPQKCISCELFKIIGRDFQNLKKLMENHCENSDNSCKLSLLHTDCNPFLILPLPEAENSA